MSLRRRPYLFTFQLPPPVNQRWRTAGVFGGAKSFELSPQAHPFSTHSSSAQGITRKRKSWQ